jgi:hypothetical protein
MELTPRTAARLGDDLLTIMNDGSGCIRLHQSNKQPSSVKGLANNWVRARGMAISPTPTQEVVFRVDDVRLVDPHEVYLHTLEVMTVWRYAVTGIVVNELILFATDMMLTELCAAVRCTSLCHTFNGHTDTCS